MSNTTGKLTKSIGKYKLIATMACAALLSVSIIETASGAPTHTVGGVYCQTFERAVLPWTNGYEVRVFEQLCDGWGGGDQVSIVLHSKKPPQNQKIFVYDRMNASPEFPGRVDVLPTVTWLNNNEIYIAIDVVGAIEIQHESADGIRISYSVGSIFVCTPEDYKRWGGKCRHLYDRGKSD